MGAISQLKQSIVSQLLDQNDFILMVVDPRCSGVCLPPHLMDSKQPVALHVGWRMAVPIPDLKLENEGISGTLSFNRTPFLCYLPWPSIVQLGLEDEHLVWVCPPPSPHEEIPQMVQEKPAENRRPKLRLV